MTVRLRKELREIEDQRRRALNLVIFNLPESNRQTAILRKKHDERKFAELCAQIGVDIPDVTTMFRLGTIKEGANRPLKIILNNKQHRKTILDNASKLRQSKEDTDLKNCIIVKDLTPQQRNYNKLRRLKILSEKPLDRKSQSSQEDYDERTVLDESVIEVSATRTKEQTDKNPQITIASRLSQDALAKQKTLVQGLENKVNQSLPFDETILGGFNNNSQIQPKTPMIQR